jgi:hypothetical protein
MGAAMKRARWLELNVLLCSLACLGANCDPFTPAGRAFVINQTDQPIDVHVHSLKQCDLALRAPLDVTRLTQGDFQPAAPLRVERRSLSALPSWDATESAPWDATEGCYDLLWIEVGDYRGIVSWATLPLRPVPARISGAVFPVSVLVEGHEPRLYVSVGDELTSYPPPPPGPPSFSIDASTDASTPALDGGTNADAAAAGTDAGAPLDAGALPDGSQ